MVSVSNPYIATITENSEYVANFEKIIYTISVSATEGGEATASAESVEQGGSVTLTATANSGYEFVNWTLNGEIVSTENPYTATITTNSEFVANFNSLSVRYTVSVSATEGGTASTSATSVEQGESVTITAVPNEGYEFDKWVINDIYMLTDLVCTIRVEEDLEIVARFVETANRHNGFEYVDLGLPSGTKWATCNVGAEESDELGGYVAWGETSSKDSYTAENYTYVNNPATLPLSADVANIYMGGNWRMPTEEEVQELIDYCTWSQTVSVSNLGASGHHITSNINGAKIFIPATGYTQGSMLQPKQYITQIWTSSIDPEDNQYAKSMYVKGTGTRKVQSSLRYKGLPIRAVFREN